MLARKNETRSASGSLCRLLAPPYTASAQPSPSGAHHFPAAAAPSPVQQHAIDARRKSMAEVPQKRDAAAASEDDQTNKKQKTEGTGLKRADGSPWEPITGTLVPIVGGKEGLKQEWYYAASLQVARLVSRRRRPAQDDDRAPGRSDQEDGDL